MRSLGSPLLAQTVRAIARSSHRVHVAQRAHAASATSQIQNILNSSLDDAFVPNKQAISSVMLPANTDPTTLTIEKHAAMQYTLREADTRTLFPEGFPGSRPNRPVLDENGRLMFPQVEEAKILTARNKMFCDRQIIVRESTLKVIQELTALGEDPAKLAAARGIVLGGLSGTGKSTALAHIIHHFRVKGWLVISIPRAADWSRRSPEWFPVRGQKGFYDQQDVATDVLRGAKASNEAKLAQIPLRDPETLELLANKTWSVPTSEDSPAKPQTGERTLLDLVNFGLSDKERSPMAGLKFRDELNHVVEFPVMIAIDEYNAWFCDTEYTDRHGFILPEQMRMIAKWRPFNGDRLKNGVIVAAVDETLPLRERIPYRREFRPDVRIIPNFSRSEMRTMLISMTESGQLMSNVDDFTINLIHAMTGGRPKEVSTVVYDNPTL